MRSCPHELAVVDAEPEHLAPPDRGGDAQAEAGPPGVAVGDGEVPDRAWLPDHLPEEAVPTPDAEASETVPAVGRALEGLDPDRGRGSITAARALDRGYDNAKVVGPRLGDVLAIPPTRRRGGDGCPQYRCGQRRRDDRQHQLSDPRHTFHRFPPVPHRPITGPRAQWDHLPRPLRSRGPAADGAPGPPSLVEVDRGPPPAGGAGPDLRARRIHGPTRPTALQEPQVVKEDVSLLDI